MSKYIELAKKIKALVNRGEDAEKQNTEKTFIAFLKKHNITIEELEGEKQEDYFFKLEKHQQALWVQVVKRVNESINCYGEIPKSKVKQFGLKGNYFITCTASEYIEIEAKHDFYYKLYKEEQGIHYSAFCRANDLLVENTDTTEKEMNLADYERWKRVHDMAQKIKVGQFNKQISDGKIK